MNVITSNLPSTAGRVVAAMVLALLALPALAGPRDAAATATVLPVVAASAKMFPATLTPGTRARSSCRASHCGLEPSDEVCASAYTVTVRDLPIPALARARGRTLAPITEPSSLPVAPRSDERDLLLHTRRLRL